METTEIATQSIEGGSGQTPESQATPPGSQESGTPQEIGAPKVDGGESQNSSQEAGRPQASEFYGRRQQQQRRIQSLEQGIQQLTTQLQEMQAASKKAPPVSEPTTSKVDPEEMKRLYWADPIMWALEREKQIRDELQKDFDRRIEEKIPTFLSQREKAQEHGRNSERAMELIFPKASPTSNETLEKRVLKDPEYAEKMIQLLKETGLDRVSETDPVTAAKTAMELYKLRYPASPPKSQNALKKEQMGSTATATALGGGKKMATEQEIRNEIAQMTARLSANSELRFDDKFMERHSFLNGELAKIAGPQQ